jgi:hypothetical protein
VDITKSTYRRAVRTCRIYILEDTTLLHLSALHIFLTVQHSIEFLHKSPNGEKTFGDEVPDLPRSGKECHFVGLEDGRTSLFVLELNRPRMPPVSSRMTCSRMNS